MKTNRFFVTLWAIATTLFLGGTATAFDKSGVAMNVSADDQRDTGNHL